MLIHGIQNAKESENSHLSQHVHRIGHHVRQTIAEQARSTLAQLPDDLEAQDGLPEPIPQSQAEYNAQVDATIRDLFPRIPHIDRSVIIEHAFNLVRAKNNMSRMRRQEPNQPSGSMPQARARNQ